MNPHLWNLQPTNADRRRARTARRRTYHEKLIMSERKTKMACKRYNGHRSWNAWNVALWIGNDEPLYRTAQDCLRRGRSATRAARLFLDDIGEGSKTPDGAVYNFKCVREALAGLSS